MRFTFVVLVSLISLVFAHPAVKRQAIDDATVLNYALTLEHLENAFYKEALARFDEKAFLDAGLPAFARGRFEQVAAHEQVHVDFLSGALGELATKPCTYKFPFTDPHSFAAMSQVIEGVGTSAYTGAAQFIKNPNYLTAAAAVLTTEARHAAWVASAVNKVAAWPDALDTPLGINYVYNIAAQFIVECPSSNPPLPVQKFPSLVISGKSSPGKSVSVNFFGKSAEGEYYATFFNGLGATVVKVVDGYLAIPAELRGQTYVVVTSDDQPATDANTLAGPAILVFEMNSKGKLIST